MEKRKYRVKTEKERLIDRLSRIEGQVRGIKKMLESDAYCIDIVMQTSAVNAALYAFNREMMALHLKGCVAEDLKAGNNEKANELVDTLKYVMR